MHTMRTTITISPDLLQEVLRSSGKKKYSEAIVTSLADYLALKRRLDFLDGLFGKLLPHRQAHIKKARRKGAWHS